MNGGGRFMNILLEVIGILGIGAWIKILIDHRYKYNLDKKRFLFEKKLDAFDLLAKNIMGFSLHEKLPRTVFENFAVSTRARLLIRNKELDRKIKQFFIDLDLSMAATKNSENDKELDEKWERLQEESLDILDALKEDLNNTL